MSCLKCLLTDVFTNVFWPNVCPKMLTNRCAYKCVLTKWVVSNAYLQMCLQMCSDQMICIKCVLTDVFTNLAHHRDLRTCFPKETKRRERSKTYFSSPQKSLLKRILAAIGALYVGIGMGLVMGMGCDEGGVFVSCRDLSGMSFSCGTQLSTDCEREGPTAPWVGSLSPIEAFLVCPFSVGSSSQVSVRGRGMPHLHLGWGHMHWDC